MGTALASGDFDSRTRLCSHIVTGATYVVRIFDKAVLAEEQWMWDRVRASIHVQRALPKHENIVEMVECFETSSSLYILMQLFPSTNVTKLLCGNRFQRLLQTGVPNGGGMTHDKCLPSASMTSSRTFLTGSPTDHETVGEGQVGNASCSSMESLGSSAPHLRIAHPESGGSPSMASFPFPVSSSPPLAKHQSMVLEKEEENRQANVGKDLEEVEEERVRSEEKNGKAQGGTPPSFIDREDEVSLIARKRAGNVLYSTVVDPIASFPTPPRSGAGGVMEGDGSAIGPRRAVSVMKNTSSPSPSFSPGEIPWKERRKRGDGQSGPTDDGAVTHPLIEGPTHSNVASIGEKKSGGGGGGGGRSEVGDDLGGESTQTSPGAHLLPKSFGPPRARNRPSRPPSTVSSHRRSCLRSVFTSEEVRQYFSQVVCAIQHMHRHHIVHFGIAPDHILIDDRGLCKVSNLISCSYCTPGRKMNELRGTRHTVAPEILSSDPFDPYLADAWSLGVLLYFMFHSRYPHDGANTLEHIMSHQLRPPATSIPSTAKDLLRSLLEPDPQRRLSVSRIFEHPFFHVESFQEEEEEEESFFTVASGTPVSSRPPPTRRHSHFRHRDQEKTAKRCRPVPPEAQRKATEVQSGDSENDRIPPPSSSLSGGGKTGGIEGAAENNDDLSRPPSFPPPSSLAKRLHAEEEEEEKEEEPLPSSSLLHSSVPPFTLQNSAIGTEDVGHTAMQRPASHPQRVSPHRSLGTNRMKRSPEGIEETWDASGGVPSRPLSPPSPFLSGEYPPSDTTRSAVLLPTAVPSSTHPSLPWGKGVGRQVSPVPHSSTISFRLSSAEIAAVEESSGGEARDGVEMKVAGGSSPSQGTGENAALVPGSFRALMQKHFAPLDRTFHSHSISGEGRGAEEGRRSPRSGSRRSSPSALATPVTALRVVPLRDPLAPSDTGNTLPHPTRTSVLGTEGRSVLSSSFPLGTTPNSGEGPVEGGACEARWRAPLGVHAAAPSSRSFTSPSEYATSSAVMYRAARNKHVPGSPQAEKSEPLAVALVDARTTLCVPWSPASRSLSSVSSPTSMESPTQRESDVAHRHRQGQRVTKMICVDSVEGHRIAPASSVLGATFQGLCPTCHRLPSSISTRNISQMPYSTTKFTFHPPHTFEITEKN